MRRRRGRRLGPSVKFRKGPRYKRRGSTATKFKFCAAFGSTSLKSCSSSVVVNRRKHDASLVRRECRCSRDNGSFFLRRISICFSTRVCVFFFFVLQFAVSAVAVVAVHAGVIPAMAGGKGAGHAKGGSDGDGGGRRVSQEDRFHLQSSDGQYVFGHTTGNQV